jgi:rhodanese-related sulfurtransferase
VHSGEHRSPRLAEWAERLWRRPLTYGAVALAALVALSIPVFALQTGMPSIKVVPEDDGSRIAYTQVQDAFGKGAPGALQVLAPKADAERAAAVAKANPGVAQVMPPMPGRGEDVMVQVVPKQDPSDLAVGATIVRLRADLPQGALVGGSVAEVLVDVREDSERARGFPPGSRHLPLLQLKQRLAELPSDRPVAFICESGRRSAIAATAARRAGLDAHNVSGGMTAWHQQGLDTTTPGRTR